jgi:parvulin-like peptidyl-prolyl isomerase
MQQCEKRYTEGPGRLAAALALALVFFVFAGPDGAGAAREAVRVNDAVLTEFDVDLVLQKILPSAVFHGGITPEKKAEYRDQAVERLVEEELLYQEAKRKGMEMEEGKLRGVKEEAIRRLGGKKNFRKALKAWDHSEKEYERRVERTFLIEKILDLEVERKSKVTDGEARAYYEENRKTFFRPEARRIRHILLSVAPSASAEEWERRRIEAGELVGMLASGEDFGKVAWDHSDDPYRVKEGDLGLLHKGRLDPGLEKAAWALEKGELSGVIQTIYGYHIVRVDEVAEPEQLGFEAVRDGIRQKMEKKRKEALREGLMSRLREGAEIEVY